MVEPKNSENFRAPKTSGSLVYQKSAGLVIYHKDKEDKGGEIKFLLLKYPNYWGFVKGLVEENENLEETARRELEEEAGIRADIIPGFQYKQEWFFRLEGKTIKKSAVFFLARTDEEQAKKVKISFEHEDFSWLTFDEALKKLKIKNNKEMIKKAYDFIVEFEKQKKLF